MLFKKACEASIASQAFFFLRRAYDWHRACLLQISVWKPIFKIHSV